MKRKAIIYVRQSSDRQVKYNVESGHLQYALVDLANSLGWKNSIVIDEDTAKSAAFYSERPGFQSMVSQVCMGEIGIVISLEASRSARNNSDWYHLLDLCTLFDTLIADYQTIYDPKDPNDRMVLGMKGTMSEMELNMIKFRMRQGSLSKAKRGELFTVLSPGYVLDTNKKVQKYQTNPSVACSGKNKSSG